MPIYAITAALSLRYMQEAVYFDAARECYEAFAVRIRAGGLGVRGFT